MNNNKFFFGAALTVLGAVLWGLSGVNSQILFQNNPNINPGWLTSTRLLSSGIIILLISFIIDRKNLFNIFKNKKDVSQLIVYSVLGMAGVQFTYFATIKASNAATATVIQYVAPVIVAVYTAIKTKKLPKPTEFIAVILAVAGVFLIATRGKLGNLALSPEALVWGLISATAMSINTIYPESLLKKYSSVHILCFSMLIGGILLSFVFSPFNIPAGLDQTAYINLAAIIIGGTVIAFLAYLIGIKYIGPALTILFASTEPLSAAVFSVILLNSHFEKMELLGFVFIISTLILLSVGSNGFKLKKKDKIKQC